MINLLIADDEHHIVNYIASLLQSRQDLGLEIYKAYSGAEAIEYAQKIKFSLILLDINMPGLSGLEVAKKIDALWPNTRILFLTAYDNFEYIYKAVSFNCCGYLLKVESDQTIVNKICEIVGEIENDLLNVKRMNEAEQKSILLSFLLHQNILKGICSGWELKRAKTELNNIPSDHQMLLDKPFYLMYACMCTPLANDCKSHDRFDYPVLAHLELMEGLLCGRFTCRAMNCGHESLLWFFQSVNQASNATDLVFLKQVSNDYVNTLYTTEHIKLISILYNEEIEYDDLSKTVYRLQNYGDHQLQADEPYVTFIDNHLYNCTIEIDNTEISAEHIEKLSSSVYGGDSTQFFKILTELKNQCLTLKSMHNLSAIKLYLSVSLMLIKFIEKNKLQESLAMEGPIYPLYSHDFSNWEQAFEYLRKTSQNIFHLVKVKKTSRSEHIVAVIKNYIAENLSSNITLAKVSELVNYNESYISRKSVTGEGVSEYVNHARLDKAKELLTATNLTVQVIADTIGFDTSQYFSNVFKKYVGVSPTDYRIYNTVV